MALEENQAEELTDQMNELVMKLLMTLGQETRGEHPMDATALSVAALGLVLTTTVGMMIAKGGVPAPEQITAYLRENALLEDCAVTAVKEIIPALKHLYEWENSKKADA